MRVRFLHSEHQSEEDRRGPDYDSERGRTEFKAFATELGFEAPDWVVSQEPPWLAIIHRVLSGGYDLVMVGKFNDQGRPEQSIGRVTMKVVRKCPCPVWVVRPNEEHAEGPVLAATELGPVGNRAVDLAASWARWRDRDLYVVHAWRVPLDLEMSATSLSPDRVQARIDQELEGIRQELLAMECVQGLGERVHAVVSEGLPSDVVRAAVERAKPQLCVLGSVGRGGIPGFLMGNTAERLIEELACSILVVKPEDFVCPVQ